MKEEIRLSRSFIEQEVPQAKPEDLAVYLMLLAVGQDFQKAAKMLGMKESDVLRAWAYWLDRGAFGKADSGIRTAEAAEEAPKQTAALQEMSSTEKRFLASAESPVYSPAEMAQYARQAEVQQLFRAAQQKLGKMLSHKDMSTIFSFHDWLGLPLDVIELLLSFCTADGSKGMGYIEKAAIGWANDGINTVDKATEYIEYRTSGTNAVMRAFGQTSRTPTPEEEGFIRTWVWEYKLPIDIIRIACERTVSQIGKVSFRYANKILKDWHEKGVKTAEDVAKLDEAFAAAKMNQAQQTANQTVQAAVQKDTAKPKQNRFINYPQSEWNFEEIERLEREQREKW